MTKVTLYSDFTCPYCYIVERSQLPLLGETAFIWKPFELHPKTPAQGRQLSRKSATDIWKHARALAHTWSVPIASKPPRVLPKTRNALAAAEAARAEGTLSEFREAAFRAFFVKGLDLGSEEVIDQLMPKSNWRDPVFFNAVDEARREALSDCVLAVPAFTRDGAVLNGLHEMKILRRFIDEEHPGDVP